MILTNQEFYLTYMKKLNYKKREYLSEWIENIKYEALCEGDDYWIDNTKLQQQVDYMESHPECTFCFHNANILDVQIISFEILKGVNAYESENLLRSNMLSL